MFYGQMPTLAVDNMASLLHCHDNVLIILEKKTVQFEVMFKADVREFEVKVTIKIDCVSNIIFSSLID